MEDDKPATSGRGVSAKDAESARRTARKLQKAAAYARLGASGASEEGQGGSSNMMGYEEDLVLSESEDDDGDDDDELLYGGGIAGPGQGRGRGGGGAGGTAGGGHGGNDSPGTVRILGFGTSSSSRTGGGGARPASGVHAMASRSGATSARGGPHGAGVGPAGSGAPGSLLKRPGIPPTGIALPPDPSRVPIWERPMGPPGGVAAREKLLAAQAAQPKTVLKAVVAKTFSLGAGGPLSPQEQPELVELRVASRKSSVTSSNPFPPPHTQPPANARSPTTAQPSPVAVLQQLANGPGRPGQPSEGGYGSQDLGLRPSSRVPPTHDIIQRPDLAARPTRPQAAPMAPGGALVPSSLVPRPPVARAKSQRNIGSEGLSDLQLTNRGDSFTSGTLSNRRGLGLQPLQVAAGAGGVDGRENGSPRLAPRAHSNTSRLQANTNLVSPARQ